MPVCVVFLCVIQYAVRTRDPLIQTCVTASADHFEEVVAPPGNKGCIILIDGRLPQYGAEERTEQEKHGYRERR